LTNREVDVKPVRASNEPSCARLLTSRKSQPARLCEEVPEDEVEVDLQEENLENQFRL
jgi:hypothetical protein